MEIEHFWGAFSLLLLALVAVEIWAAILPKWRPSEQLIREQLILSNHCVSTKQNWKIISETCSACFEPWIELIFRQLMTTFSRKTWVILATRCRQDLRPKHDAICWPSDQVTHCFSHVQDVKMTTREYQTRKSTWKGVESGPFFHNYLVFDNF